jgi:hypothetical protein
MSISSKGAAGISPEAVRNGRASGAITARAVRDRMVSVDSVMAILRTFSDTLGQLRQQVYTLASIPSASIPPSPEGGG